MSNAIGRMAMKFLHDDGMLNSSICLNSFVMATNSDAIITSSSVKSLDFKDFGKAYFQDNFSLFF